MISWRRKWQPPPVFLPGESYRQRSLVVYGPWGRKQLGMTEWHFHASISSSIYSLTVSIYTVYHLSLIFYMYRLSLISSCVLIHPSISFCPSVCLSILIHLLSVCLSMCLSVHPSHVASYRFCPLSICIPIYLPSVTSLPSSLFFLPPFSSSFPSFLPPASTPSLIHSSPPPPLFISFSVNWFC